MTGIRKPLLATALLLGSAGFFVTAMAASPAAPSGYSTTYDSCMNATSTTAGMVGCSAAETKRQDERLNANYQAGMKTLDPQQRTALRAVQRLWIQFRDADCAMERGLTGGTIDQINAQSCLLQATKVRADSLAVRFLPQDQ
jgi:uncharacterized protein YecT (DUF1311 family)